MDKIIAEFADGKRRVLKSPDKLAEIDESRAALFVFDNGQVYEGKTDGDIDEDGDFRLMNDDSSLPGIMGIGLPFDRLIGWAYVTAKHFNK